MKSPNTYFEIDEPGPSDLKADSKFKEKRKLMQHFFNGHDQQSKRYGVNWRS
jgi:hypothetical protein